MQDPREVVSKDISTILAGWPYDPERVSVRIVKGLDGRDKIQVRLDLGLLQMEMDGRPDGQTAEGFESWLDYFMSRQREHDAANPDRAAFVLEREDCAKLLREGIQYYHRYVSFWHLQRYELCARDTNRNLRLFAFVREHARHQRDRLQFDQFRPFVTMMHARAVATPMAELGQFEAALKAIDAGIAGIRRFLEEYQQEDQAAECGELSQLQRWRDEIIALLKASDDGSVTVDSPLAKADGELEEIEDLRQRMEAAIADERFEEAARLRDEIRRRSAG